MPSTVQMAAMMYPTIRPMMMDALRKNGEPKSSTRQMVAKTEKPRPTYCGLPNGCGNDDDGLHTGCNHFTHQLDVAVADAQRLGVGCAKRAATLCGRPRDHETTPHESKHTHPVLKADTHELDTDQYDHGANDDVVKDAVQVAAGDERHDHGNRRHHCNGANLCIRCVVLDHCTNPSPCIQMPR